MVEVHYRDRLGNNLFQYCLGRLIAEELGLKLSAKPLTGFPETCAIVAGKTHEAPLQILTGNKIDLSSILSDLTARRIIVDGWFQRHEYYTPYRSRIQKWLAFDPAFDVPCCDAEVVVNVRRTDYVGLGWALPFAYYEEGLAQLLPPRGRVVIVTDDSNDCFFSRFKPWKPKFFRGSPLQQIAYMSHAPRLVMSASTFSWWPAFLGSAEAVVCPVPNFGIWSVKGESEVNLIEHDRFIGIACEIPYLPNIQERLYQRYRSYRHRGIKWLNTHLGLNLPMQTY